jgi:hypothetical protein
MHARKMLRGEVGRLKTFKIRQAKHEWAVIHRIRIERTAGTNKWNWGRGDFALRELNVS